jgi:pyruvate dehydrogenase E1 component
MSEQIENDQLETKEWLDSIDAVMDEAGSERAHEILELMIDHTRRQGINLPFNANTAYMNTIPPHKQKKSPGNHEIERTLRSYIRWNAMAMVAKANKLPYELGGHIASFASAATLYDVAFNHFFHAQDKDHGGDLVFFQGHSAPGIYARAYLEGRITEEQMDNFRQETKGKGLPSYPHPWLMEDFWQFPTVSMGLGPIMAIYQARFLKYLEHRGLAKTHNRKVWAFLGDGETDEPESLGAISLAGREKLDNLNFVVNCNLQRLDGPVRGNGKIIQELESVFRGAGWNVIKVVWGSYWDPLFEMDKKGLMLKRMEEVVDGEYQNYKAKGGAYTREHFFGKYPELKELISSMSDSAVWRLNRGGHDPHKVYAAFAAAAECTGQPTVILAKTVKGYGMGKAGEGQNKTHSQKKLDLESLKGFRDRFKIPVSNEDIEDIPYIKPAEDSPEMKYLHERRKALGGYLPSRNKFAAPLEVPKLDAFAPLLKSTGDKEMSTTMALVRIITLLARDKKVGKNIVPIVPDEARTFGMEGMFRQLGIYSSVGQLYEPQDKSEIMYYKEDKSGQILEEGINEAGAMSSWIAAATAYSNHGINMIPFYVYYSMFGYQRVGDLMWAAGDMRARGFLIGGTAGRTSLNGEGLQHQDGHSHMVANTIPNNVSYDPTFAYELAVIVQHGMKRMYEDQENVFFYITTMNENYTHPAMPEDCEEGIIKGLYLFSGKKSQRKTKGGALRVQLMGSGTILREVIEAGKLLKADFNVNADVWSAPSLNELRREGQDVERWNMMNPEATPKISYVETCLKGQKGPVVVATDYMKNYADQIRQYVPATYKVLGTDGFGRSDSREALREFFEVDRYYIVLTALNALLEDGEISPKLVTEAIIKYNLDPNKPNPISV